MHAAVLILYIHTHADMQLALLDTPSAAGTAERLCFLHTSQEQPSEESSAHCSGESMVWPGGASHHHGKLPLLSHCQSPV